MALNMENTGSSRLQSLVQLISMFPETELFAMERFARFLSSQIEDPVVKMLINAPIDTEPLTEEEERNIQESLEAYAKGDIINFEDLAKELPNKE